MMQYQIKCDDNILYDLRDKNLFVESPNLNLEINKVGTLTFSIYPDHPYFDRLIKLKSKIAAKRGNKDIFRGRIINDEQGIYNEKNIECESSLAYLNDSIYRPSSFTGTPEELFTLIFNNHNSQVTDDQKLKIGNVTVTDPNNYISRSWEDYLSSWELFKTRLLDTLGGYLVERYEDDGTYIDWLEDFKNGDSLLVSTQTIEFGENLINILAKNDASTTYSVVIPLGYEIENEDGTKERLTIKSVNDNKDYLVNETALAAYGWKVAPVSETTWDDVTVASNLKTKGQDYLNNQAVMIASTLEITALDLAAIDKDIEFFFIYKYVRIKSTPHNFNKAYLLKSITIPFDHPESTQITLGETSSTLTGIELGNKQKIDGVITRVETIEADYVTNEVVGEVIESELTSNPNITNIINEVVSSNTSILQNAENIIMTALQDYVATSDFETFQQTISTQFEQTASAFNFNFTNLTSQINNLNGTTQQQFQEISKYIRFENGNIILGEAGNEITLKIENDRISFLQNNSEVAYLSNNKLVVTDGEFLNSLIIGNFAWKPRENGNLSLVKIGGGS
jgi:hypothetical protein